MSRHEIIAILATLSVSSYTLTGCGSKEGRDLTTGTQQETNGKSMVIRFDQTSNTVTEIDKNRMKEMISKIGINNIDRIEIAVWSDKEFPKQNFELFDVDRELADQRANQVRGYLESLQVPPSKVKIYNMAESSSWLSRSFSTKDAELKSIFAGTGDPSTYAEFDTIAREGGPSKAVMVIVTKTFKETQI